MSAALQQRPVPKMQLHWKLAFLKDMHSYKVAYGGRASLKSTSFAAMLLTLGINQSLRVLCLREVQKSLADSVHLLLGDQIRKLGYGQFYTVTENAIRGHLGTLFRFTGLSDQTAESMKSFEGFDVFWFEEAQAITRRSFQIALPTLFRTKDAEAWVSFNPDMDTDEVWERFVVNTPPGAKIIEMNWRDGAELGWMSEENERLRQYDLKHFPDDYANIWEGKPRTVVAGAIYAREVVEMMTEHRFRPIPYDPRLPVHRVWDLGWNDLMTVIMVQKPHPSALNVINYIEDSHVTYAALLAVMDRLNYKWGDDWLPHDAGQHHPTSGTNAWKQIKTLSGRTPKDIPRSDPEARIRAARMMWPRVYVDNSKHDTPTDRPDRLLGASHLIDRLKRYKRNVPRSTNEPAGPTHDIASHGCFAGDTKILTRHGMYQIKDLPETGEVLTPCGWRLYQNPRITRTNAPLVEVQFVDGTTVKCTPDHLFLTVIGWKSASDLQKRTVVQSSLIQSLSTSMDIYTNSIAVRDIGRRAEADSTGTYGPPLLGQFLRDVTSTIATIARRTTISPIWNACLPANICPAPGMSLMGMGSTTRRVTLRPAPERLPLRGTLPQKDAFGTVVTPQKHKGGEGGNERLCRANFAGRCLAAARQRVLVGVNIALRLVRPQHTATVRPLRIETVRRLSEVADVWDITVPDAGCFSLENGAVVHNSDAWGGLAEIVDRIRNEGDLPVVSVPAFHNSDPSMGLLG